MALDRAPLPAGGHLGQAAHTAALDQPDAGGRCPWFENDFTWACMEELAGGKQLLIPYVDCGSRDNGQID